MAQPANVVISVLTPATRAITVDLMTIEREYPPERVELCKMVAAELKRLRGQVIREHHRGALPRAGRAVSGPRVVGG